MFTAARFERCLGELFRVAFADAPPLEFTLASVERAGGEPPPGARVPFSAVFHGPPEPVLPQRIYHLEHDRLGGLDIFIVPIGPAGDAMEYEAVFT